MWIEDHSMGESEVRTPAEVVRTRRLKIGDEGGKVRAVLGTNDEGITSLSVLDQGGTLRALLDASDRSEQVNSLVVFGLTKDGQAGLSFSASRKIGTSRWQSGKMATST
jgi:hypothetical protein